MGEKKTFLFAVLYIHALCLFIYNAHFVSGKHFHPNQKYFIKAYYLGSSGSLNSYVQKAAAKISCSLSLSFELSISLSLPLSFALSMIDSKKTHNNAVCINFHSTHGSYPKYWRGSGRLSVFVSVKFVLQSEWKTRKLSRELWMRKKHNFFCSLYKLFASYDRKK